MKLKGITLLAGVVATGIASLGLWQLTVVALLLRGIDQVVTAFAQLL